MSEGLSVAEVLEPCPFCGGHAAFGSVTYAKRMVREQGWDQSVFHSVNCVLCGVCNRGIVGHLSQAKAAAAWNRRSLPTQTEGTGNG